MKAAIPGEEPIRLHQRVCANEEVGNDPLTGTPVASISAPTGASTQSGHRVDRRIAHWDLGHRPGRGRLVGEDGRDLGEDHVARHDRAVSQTRTQGGQ